MRRPLVTCALVAALAVPATAAAETVEIGSDLSARATLAQSHPRDWAAWPTALASGDPVTAPVQGEVTKVQFKGTVLKAPRGDHPPFAFLVAVMRPEPGSTERFVVASQSLDYPFGGDEQRITTFDLQKFDAQLCVKPGDHVALATNGGFGAGFYDDGYPVQMFARVPDSSIAVHEEPPNDGNGFQVGDSVNPDTRADQELLMRATIGTGNDSRPSCRSEEETQGPTVRLPDQPTRRKLNKAGKISLTLECASLRACSGSVFLKHSGKPVGTAQFSLGGHTTGTVKVLVNPNGMRLLGQRGGKLGVEVIVRPKGGKRTSGAFKLVK